MITSYLSIFLAEARQGKTFNNAPAEFGTRINMATLSESQTRYWRVIGLCVLPGRINAGNHHVYCDVLDEAGHRLRARVVATKQNNVPLPAMTDKPDNEAGCNFPLWSADVATVRVEWDGIPSESVSGLHTQHPDGEVGNTRGHWSFYVVWQRTPATGPEEEPATLEQAAAAAGQSLIIPLNKEAFFWKLGQAEQLGERLTKEYDFLYEGDTYRAQIFERGVVCAPVGQWNAALVFPREN